MKFILQYLDNLCPFQNVQKKRVGTSSYLSVSLSVYPSIRISIYPSIYRSVHPSIRPSNISTQYIRPPIQSQTLYPCTYNPSKQLLQSANSLNTFSHLDCPVPTAARYEAHVFSLRTTVQPAVRWYKNQFTKLFYQYKVCSNCSFQLQSFRLATGLRPALAVARPHQALQLALPHTWT